MLKCHWGILAGFSMLWSDLKIYFLHNWLPLLVSGDKQEVSDVRALTAFDLSLIWQSSWVWSRKQDWSDKENRPGFKTALEHSYMRLFCLWGGRNYLSVMQWPRDTLHQEVRASILNMWIEMNNETSWWEYQIKQESVWKLGRPNC